MDATRLRTRRAVLTSGFAALAGFAAGAVGHAAPTRAATDDPLILGKADNSVDKGTGLDFHGEAPIALEITVHGAADRTGIRAQAGGAGYGVVGFSYSGVGIGGGTVSGDGLEGVAYGSGDGVMGKVANPGQGAGLRGAAPAGRGAVLSGGLSQLRLVPSSRARHPERGEAGDLFLDKAKRLWLCKGGTTWKQIA